MKSVVTYLWQGSRDFRPSYVSALARMVKHHLPEPHRFICVSDVTDGFSADVEVLPMPVAAQKVAHVQTPERSGFPSSYRRLWTFSQEATQLGESVLMLDIDCVIVADMRRLWNLDADFVGWSVRPPAGGPPRYGGGTWLHRTGTRTEVWERFIADPDGCIALARNAGYRGSDQAWISYCLSKRDPCWPEPSGIVCSQDFRNPTPIRVPVRPPQFNGGMRRRKHFRTVKVPPVVPPDSIVLHMNGAAKPWNSSDDIAVKYWQPYHQ